MAQSGHKASKQRSDRRRWAGFRLLLRVSTRTVQGARLRFFGGGVGVGGSAWAKARPTRWFISAENDVVLMPARVMMTMDMIMATRRRATLSKSSRAGEGQTTRLRIEGRPCSPHYTSWRWGEPARDLVYSATMHDERSL
ncbi:hypothetical protein K461DRAFT_24274 [Myriangium duriaei CBS 260.36]|uniref:Uncharacterized protein n=1 Tax=Myriangium duriaei CBS 260.36 TaxID=1168546 RepID=A0A9P4JDT4_9PEZI|nr:hypothetical protein K461DRAFT_24274 [Myriangium duriaei CBS 260.36]